MPKFVEPIAIKGIVRWGMLAGTLTAIVGCGGLPKSEAQTGQQQANAGPASVDVAIARALPLQQPVEYTGTTQPYRQVSLRSQVEGTVLDLAVDVGDRVTQGQTVGQLNDAVLAAAVVEAEAEVAARQADVAEANAEVSTAQTQVEDQRLRLQQTRSDLARLELLFREGAIAAQAVETARTAAGTAQQALRSAEAQVRTRRQAVTAIQRRVIAQRAIVAQEKERQSQTQLTSPVTGSVLERVTEPGNLAQPGSEILKLGDFSRVKVVVQVSERELGSLRVGQPVQVRLDAFPQKAIAGRIARISPAADPTSRLIPIEVIIPNSDESIGSGLLARVNFAQQQLTRVVVPETALQTDKDRRSRSPSSGDAQAADRPSPTQGNIFTIAQGEKPTVSARPVTLGKRLDGKVEVVSGLGVGDRFVSRSSKALKNGDPVKLSSISEGQQKQVKSKK
ncbi:efflux RND transporter periplasmic adaptor subunit [Leptolyngbyaceae cyanobacterium UHCC 1019]